MFVCALADPRDLFVETFSFFAFLFSFVLFLCCFWPRSIFFCCWLSYDCCALFLYCFIWIDILFHFFRYCSFFFLSYFATLLLVACFSTLFLLFCFYVCFWRRSISVFRWHIIWSLCIVSVSFDICWHIISFLFIVLFFLF